MTSLTTRPHYVCYPTTITPTGGTTIHDGFTSLFRSSGLDHELIQQYSTWLVTQAPELTQHLTTYFNAPNDTHFTPLFIYHAPSNRIFTILADRNDTPSQPGEWGSLLAYIRQHEYDDSVLCSDCFGQLSCSSCAVEVLSGHPTNPIPREEEYDMLDIDEDRPPTSFTRLGCQIIIGNEAMVIKVR